MSATDCYRRANGFAIIDSCRCLVVLALVAMSSVVLGSEPTPVEAEFDLLRQRYAKELEQYWANVDDGKNDEVHAKYVREHWPGNSMANDFIQLEAKHRGTKVGISALYHIVSAGGHPTPDAPSSMARRQALRVLQDHYADHADLDLFCFWLDAGEFTSESKSLLQRATQSPHRHVSGAALLTLARIYQSEATIPGRMDGCLELLKGQTGELNEWFTRYAKIRKRYGNVDAAESRRAALAALDHMDEKYADVLEPPRVGYGPVILEVKRSEVDSLTNRARRKLSELADAMRFELTNLAIGQKAVDISGPDAFGKEMKLSDYLGSVVVLMFSFKGCGPCEAMYPANRKLVEEYRRRPFAFLGVMGDEELETLKQSVKGGAITWPVWWDGGLSGPIARRWNVSAWPDIYVLDHQGVIRYRKLPSEVLALAVSRLMEQAEQDQKRAQR